MKINILPERILIFLLEINCSGESVEINNYVAIVDKKGIRPLQMFPKKTTNE